MRERDVTGLPLEAPTTAVIRFGIIVVSAPRRLALGDAGGQQLHVIEKTR